METLKPGLWKFVKVGGNYRFFNPDIEHKSMVQPGEVAESAGAIGVREEFWMVVDNYSMSLRIGFAKDTVEELTEVLGIPLREV